MILFFFYLFKQWSIFLSLKLSITFFLFQNSPILFQSSGGGPLMQIKAKDGDTLAAKIDFKISAGWSISFYSCKHFLENSIN